jgi:hypothetical protein
MQLSGRCTSSAAALVAAHWTIGCRPRSNSRDSCGRSNTREGRTEGDPFAHGESPEAKVGTGVRK